MTGPTQPADPVGSTQEIMGTVAQSVIDSTQRLGLTWELLPATVTGSGTRSVSIMYDGDSVSITAISLVGPLVAGVRIYAVHIPPSGNFIIGFATMPGFVDGVNVTSGSLVGPVSAETDIPQLALSGLVKAGYTYLIGVQLFDSVTTTTDDWQIQVRRDTAVTGAVICQAGWSGDDLLGTHYWSWAFKATVDETLNLFFSVLRTAGAGTVTIFGSPGGPARTMSFLTLSAPSSLWRSA